MIFVRYKGASPAFIQGKTYVAKAEMDGPAGLCSFFEVNNEYGEMIRVGVDEEKFEFLKEVYVVVVHPFNGFCQGDVIVAEDASEDGLLLKINGEGYCVASDFIILDRTNVYPGIVVCDSSDGKWKKITRVDEALWVMVQDENTMRSPEEFTFAVSLDEQMMVEPMIKCLSNEGLNTLTVGNHYYLLETKENGDFVVKNDIGVLEEFMPWRFQMG